jgi:hypothetical protein
MAATVTTPVHTGQRSRAGIAGLSVSALVAALTLGACAAPQQRAVEQAAPPPPPPSTQVFFYPTRGQSAAQQDRDRYECYLWARQQTGFDPSTPQLAPHQRVQVEPNPPAGHDTATGAVTGAVLGAVVAPPGRKAEGAVAGAIVGTAVGAASDSARQEQAERVQDRYDQRDAKRMARLEQQAAGYRRAMSACLSGRGYRVQ